MQWTCIYRCLSGSAIYTLVIVMLVWEVTSWTFLDIHGATAKVNSCTVFLESSCHAQDSLLSSVHTCPLQPILLVCSHLQILCSGLNDLPPPPPPPAAATVLLSLSTASVGDHGSPVTGMLAYSLTVCFESPLRLVFLLKLTRKCLGSKISWHYFDLPIRIYLGGKISWWLIYPLSVNWSIKTLS